MSYIRDFMVQNGCATDLEVTVLRDLVSRDNIKD